MLKDNMVVVAAMMLGGLLAGIVAWSVVKCVMINKDLELAKIYLEIERMRSGEGEGCSREGEALGREGEV